MCRLSCPQAKIIGDIDPSRLDKIKTVAWYQGDVAAVLAELAPQVKANLRETWLGHITELKRASRMPGINDPRTPYGADSARSPITGRRATITTDVGQLR